LTRSNSDVPPTIEYSNRLEDIKETIVGNNKYLNNLKTGKQKEFELEQSKHDSQIASKPQPTNNFPEVSQFSLDNNNV